jgi:hypothetical protein
MLSRPMQSSKKQEDYFPPAKVWHPAGRGQLSEPWNATCCRYQGRCLGRSLMAVIVGALFPDPGRAATAYWLFLGVVLRAGSLPRLPQWPRTPRG